jgi:hypothetical protein
MTFAGDMNGRPDIQISNVFSRNNLYGFPRSVRASVLASTVFLVGLEIESFHGTAFLLRAHSGKPSAILMPFLILFPWAYSICALWSLRNFALQRNCIEDRVIGKFMNYFASIPTLAYLLLLGGREFFVAVANATR